MFIYIYIMHLADALSKATYIALHSSYSFYILSDLAFPGNRTHDLGVANAMLYQLSYRKAMYSYISMYSILVGSGISHFSLDNTHRFSGVQVRRVCNTMVIEPGFWYLWQCGQVPSPVGKWNQHLHKACQQKEAWSALKFPGRWLRWLWTSDNTVDQHQQMTCSPNHHWLWKLHTGLQATWILCLSTLPPDAGTLISKLNAIFTFLWKEDFGPLSNSPVIFLLSPGKMLLTMFLFQKWVGSPFPEDVWAWWLLMHWLQLQFTPCEALPSVWISFAWQYSSSYYYYYSQACGHPCCLCTFSYPISSFQSTLHLYALIQHSLNSHPFQ